MYTFRPLKSLEVKLMANKTSKGTKRVVRLVDAPNLADGEAIMLVEGGGLKSE